MKLSWHYFSWLFSLPLLLLAVCFAVGNREPTIINLWPLGDILTMDIYLVGLLPLAVGLLSGAGMQWFIALRHKMAAQKLGKEIAQLKLENAKLKEQIAAAGAAPTMPDNPNERSRFKMIAGLRGKA